MSQTNAPLPSFDEALKILGIEDFKERIWHSNSRGELFHIYDFIIIASADNSKFREKFRQFFLGMVDFAERKWRYPEHVFQHVPRMIDEWWVVFSTDRPKFGSVEKPLEEAPAGGSV